MKRKHYYFSAPIVVGYMDGDTWNVKRRRRIARGYVFGMTPKEARLIVRDGVSARVGPCWSLKHAPVRLIRVR